jgi:hypothetical protein
MELPLMNQLRIEIVCIARSPCEVNGAKKLGRSKLANFEADLGVGIVSPLCSKVQSLYFNTNTSIVRSRNERRPLDGVDARVFGRGNGFQAAGATELGSSLACLGQLLNLGFGYVVSASHHPSPGSWLTSHPSRLVGARP